MRDSRHQRAIRRGHDITAPRFDATLASFRAGQERFTDAAVARTALSFAIQELDRTDQNLSAWERALSLD